MLRQFRLTGTKYGQTLLQIKNFRTTVKISQTTISLITDEQKFDHLLNSWFSSKVSMEAMKRRSVNETSVMDFLRATDLIIGFFEVILV